MGTNPYTPPDAPIEVENSRSDRDSRFGSACCFFFRHRVAGLLCLFLGPGLFFGLQ